MHILIIPSWYKSDKYPNAGVFFEEKARALKKRGHQVGIIFPSFLDENSESTISYSEFDDNGIFTIYQYVKPISKRSSKINNRFFLFRLYHKAYKRYVKQMGTPTVIHSHVYKYAGMFGAYLNKRKQIPHVFTEHFSVWVNLASKMPPSDIRVINDVLKWSNQAIAVSHFLKGGLIKYIDKEHDINVLPNMINDIFFKKEKQIIKSSKFRFINVGSLTTVKNHLMLLKAFSVFLNKYNLDSELYIVGDGVLKEIIKNEIRLLKLENNVFLTGNLSRNAIKTEIKKSHVGVISSVVETFSIAGIEFMSQGLPVVTTNCGGPNDYIREFNGVVVNSKEEMVTSLFEIQRDYKKYNPIAISEYIKSNFSEAVITAKLERIYKAIIK